MELARALADAARSLDEQVSLEATVRQVASLARTIVPGVDAAGLSVAGGGLLHTAAATDDLAAAGDAAQYETAEGPCLEAAWDQHAIHIDDLTRDRRWPQFTARARHLGIGSLLACHLGSQRGVLSALNLYARAAGAFDQHAQTVARLYATHATIALQSARRDADLRAGLQARERIGRAVGMLMLRHHLTDQQAFALLSSASQKLNIKLRDLAEIVSTSSVDITDTGTLARLAATEAGNRVSESHDQLASEHSIRIRGATREQVGSAKRRARAALTDDPAVRVPDGPVA
jgi:hypothetical protein